MPNRAPELCLYPTGWQVRHCPVPARSIFLVILLLIPSLFTWAAEDPPLPQGSNSLASDLTTDQLIERLGDSSFTVREKAAEVLAQKGTRAQKELKRALLNPDLEIRMRAHRILVKSLQSEFAAKIAAFISDVDGKQTHDLPGWKTYRKVIGNDRNTRALFAEMVRRESELLEAMDSGRQLAPIFSKRLAELRPVQYSGSTGQPSQPETLATLLLVATESNLLSNGTYLQKMYNVLNYSSTKPMIQGSRHSNIIMKMMKQLVLKETSSTQHYYAVMLTLNYDMKTAGLTLGRRLLKAQPNSYITIQNAAIAVARFGDVSDVPLLEPHLKNISVCHTWSNPKIKPGVIKTQVRDVVLALLIHLTKQDHKEYGFELLRESPTTLFHSYTCGFADEEKRETAQAKWRTWSEKNKLK